MTDQTTHTINDEDEFFSGGGIKYFGFPIVGTTISGTVCDKMVTRQQTDMKTKEPLTWPDGNPRLVLVIPLQTTLADPQVEDDDGKRTIWVAKPGGMYAAIMDAVKTAGATAPKLGGQITLQYIGDGEKTNPGLNAPKIFRAHYVPPSDAFFAANGNGAQQVPAANQPWPPTPVPAAAPPQVQPQVYAPPVAAPAPPAPAWPPAAPPPPGFTYGAVPGTMVASTAAVTPPTAAPAAASAMPLAQGVAPQQVPMPPGMDAAMWATLTPEAQQALLGIAAK